MESNKRREGMYNIIDLQLMGGLSEHKNGGPGGYDWLPLFAIAQIEGAVLCELHKLYATFSQA